jgi:hypothetical protein
MHLFCVQNMVSEYGITYYLTFFHVFSTLLISVNLEILINSVN